MIYDECADQYFAIMERSVYFSANSRENCYNRAYRNSPNKPLSTEKVLGAAQWDPPKNDPFRQ